MTNELKYLQDELIKNNTLEAENYNKFEVKRGLRNKDGSGVLAGLTKISSVLGFYKIEGELTPIEGILKYRGTELKDIISTLDKDGKHYFEATCFLLLVGRMPTPSELGDFSEYMHAHRDLPQEILDIITNIPSKDIMNKLQTSVSALYAFDDKADDLGPYENFLKSVRLIAKLPLVVAYSYLRAIKNSTNYKVPPKELSQAEAFLYALNEGKTPDAFEAKIVDLSLVLHAEHGGGNNSTFTTYVVTSSGSDLYSTIAAAIASLKGPLHGAANKKVMEMMDNIKTNVSDWTNKDEVCAYLEKIIKKEANDKSGKIYGLGHAVYTKSDPRAVSILELASEIAKTNNKEDELALYNLIAKEGPGVFNRVKGIEKVISPNVDFFSGFVYSCIGIPQEIYTPLFAMSRAAGWCAHRIEENLSGKRIIRPGYKFIASK
jgi:citrate synthase